MKILNILQNLFNKKSDKEENCKIEEVIPKFDKKYKIILHYLEDDSYFEKLDWVNKNSNGLVDMQVIQHTGQALCHIYYAFENEDDATFFRIKYGN